MGDPSALAAGAGTAGDASLERALAWIRLLSEEVGPRRPTSAAERRAAELMRGELRRRGLEAQLEPFRGYATFLAPYAVILGAALAPVLLPRRRKGLRAALAAAAAGLLAAEGGLVRTPLSDVLSARESANLVATVEPRREARRTLCLSCHLDTSRSGVMFAPGVVEHLNTIITAQSSAVLAQAWEPLLGRWRAGRAALGAARAVAAAGLALLVERELRGEDVPGASDNASGSAIAACLAAECAHDPPAHTRVVLLMTGCEESGLLGSQSFLRARDTTGWLFLNFDNLGGPATLRFLRREGVLAKWDADPGLVRATERLRERRPELGLEPTDSPAGLTYDSSPVLARGGRALTFSAQDCTIPNLHLPSDTYEALDPDVIRRALEVGREMIAAVDRGEAG